MTILILLAALLLAGCQHVVPLQQLAAPPSQEDVAEGLVDPERRGRQLPLEAQRVQLRHPVGSGARGVLDSGMSM